MTKLLVPDYIADPKSPLEQAYVKAQDRVLDPTKIPASVIDRLPKPTGWRILVLPYRGKAVTKGGVHLAEEFQERQALASIAGYVLRVGPTAYADASRYPTGPWCKEGDWILFGRYAGARFKIEGGEVRLLNDDEVIATISDPEDILMV